MAADSGILIGNTAHDSARLRIGRIFLRLVPEEAQIEFQFDRVACDAQVFKASA